MNRIMAIVLGLLLVGLLAACSRSAPRPPEGEHAQEAMAPAALPAPSTVVAPSAPTAGSPAPSTPAPSAAAPSPPLAGQLGVLPPLSLAFPASGTVPPSTPVLFAVDVCNTGELGRPVPFLRLDACDGTCDVAPLQCLARAEDPSACFLTPRVSLAATDERPLQQGWQRLASVHGATGCRTPVAEVVSAWLAGRGVGRTHEVLVLWFDGMVDHQNQNQIVHPTDLPRVAGAWVLVGQVTKARPADRPLVVYVLARAGATPDSVLRGRALAAALARQAASPQSQDYIRFAAGSPLELAPGGVRYRAQVELQPGLLGSPPPGTSPPALPMLSWRGVADPTARPLPPGQELELPGTLQVQHPVAGARLTIGWLAANLEQPEAAVPRLEVRITEDSLPPAGLPYTVLGTATGGTAFEPRPGNEGEPTLAWGFDEVNQVGDLSQTALFFGSCPTSVPPRPQRDIALQWPLGELVPCPLGPGKEERTLAVGCGTVTLPDLRGTWPRASGLVQAGAGPCSVRAGLTRALRNPAVQYEVAAHAWISRVVLRGTLPPECEAGLTLAVDDLGLVKKVLSALPAACASPLTRYLEGVVQSPLGDVMAGASFRFTGSGTIKRKVLALDSLTRLGRGLAQRDQPRWTAERDVLHLVLKAPYGK